MFGVFFTSFRFCIICILFLIFLLTFFFCQRKHERISPTVCDKIRVLHVKTFRRPEIGTLTALNRSKQWQQPYRSRQGCHWSECCGVGMWDESDNNKRGWGGKKGWENKTEVQNRKGERRQTMGERVVRGDSEGGTRWERGRAERHVQGHFITSVSKKRPKNERCLFQSFLNGYPVTRS